MAPNSRRNFLKASGLLGLGLTLFPKNIKAQDKPLSPLKFSQQKVKIGFVGIGARGITLLKGLLNFDVVEIAAICDIREDRVERAEKVIVEKGLAKPKKYSKGEYDFERMCEKEELDLVVNATPWKWHTPICLAAMNNGKHTATEVPAALTIDECWQLVESSERNNKHCVILENYCYFKNVMLITNMVANMKFGELIHFEGRTQENWIAQNWHIFNSNGTLAWCGENLANMNCNAYPTHGIGPIATWCGINKGDQFDYFVSMSSDSYCMQEAVKKEFGSSHELAKRKYKQGDTNITLLRTKRGKTFTLYYGGTSPQPWSPEYKIQGTKGTAIGEMLRRSNSDNWRRTKLFFEGSNRRWQKADDYISKNEHPLWEKYGRNAMERKVNNWSGEYDYLMLYQLLFSIQQNINPPMDVYDAAAWSSIIELSGQSVANNSKPIDFPDFTKGKWKNRNPDLFMNF
jgi:predicted dehydrogenase